MPFLAAAASINESIDLLLVETSSGWLSISFLLATADIITLLLISGFTTALISAIEASVPAGKAESKPFFPRLTSVTFLFRVEFTSITLAVKSCELTKSVVVREVTFRAEENSSTCASCEESCANTVSDVSESANIPLTKI